MSLVTLPYNLTNGTVADATQVMGDLTAITNVVNGNIDNTNLSNTLTITDNKLAQIQSAAKVNGTALTNLAGIPSGAGIIPAANLTYVNVQYPYVKVSETQASGTDGGTATSGSWITRVLNTTDADTQLISSLGSNEVNLPAGTYIVKAVSAFHATDATQLRIYNVTGTSVLLTGLNSYFEVNDAVSGTATVFGLITLSTSSAIAVQYQVGNGVSSNGLGYACSFGTEVYTMAEFIKIQ